MIEKIECTCIEAYTTRKMRDPNCCACSCDHNDLVEQLAKANEDYKALFTAFESCQDELKESNERESVLSCHLDSHIERVAELEKENKRESMELRSRLGSALGRNSEYSSAIENMQQKLAKANERVKELENEILENYEYETEYDGRIYSFCIHCEKDMEHTGVHHELCIVRQLRKEQSQC